MDPDEFVLTATEERLRALQEAIDFMSSRVEAPLRRRLITRPAGGVAGPRPYIITQTDGTVSEGNIAVYRYCGLTDLTAKLASPVTPFLPNGLFTPTGDDVSLNVQLMSGVAFTGQIVMAQPVGSAKLIVGGWSNSFFRGEAVDAINDAAEGLVDLQYVDYEGTSLAAPVTAVNAVGRGIEAGMVVYVWYGSDSEGERFYIQSVECPLI